MSEFIKKLNSSELVSKAWDEIDRDQACAGLLIDTISNEFKDWQPPKPLMVVPQFVADWFEDRILGSFSAVVASYSFSDGEAITWVHDNGGLDLLCKMKLYGYTVEREPKFSLVNKITGEYLVLPAIEYRIKNENIFDHSTHRKKDDLPRLKPEMYQFTEVEIDSMETGSYEQIEVEPWKTQKLS